MIFTVEVTALPWTPISYHAIPGTPDHNWLFKQQTIWCFCFMFPCLCSVSLPVTGDMLSMSGRGRSCIKLMVVKEGMCSSCDMWSIQLLLPPEICLPFPQRYPQVYSGQGILIWCDN